MYFFYIGKMYPIARPRNGEQQRIVKFKTDIFEETVGKRKKKKKMKIKKQNNHQRNEPVGNAGLIK